MADEELRIRIEEDVDDIDTQPKVVAKVDEEKKKEPADPAVKDLKDQFKSLQTQQQDAERRAAEAQAEAERLRKENISKDAEVRSSQLDTVTTALEAANSAIEAAQRDIQSAIEAGDARAQTDAYTRLAKATTVAQRMEEAKSDLEAEAKNPQRAALQRPAPPSDPVEAFISNRTPRTAAWLRQNLDKVRGYIADPRKIHKLSAADADAQAEGYAPDTDAYFQHVEKFLGMSDVAKKEDAPKRKETPPVAPGGTVRGEAPGSNEVILSAREARAANDGTHVWNYDDPSPNRRFKKGDPIGTQEFARRKREMQRQGLYDKTYTEN